MKLIAIIGVVFVICFVGFMISTAGMSDMKKMVINEVDLSKVSDGVYTGKFHKARWTHVVEVIVKDHKIAALKNTSKIPNPSYQKFVDKAIDAIMAKQSVKIDVISGATLNTRAFQKAVENALTQGSNSPNK